MQDLIVGVTNGIRLGELRRRERVGANQFREQIGEHDFAIVEICRGQGRLNLTQQIRRNGCGRGLNLRLRWCFPGRNPWLHGRTGFSGS